jgi:putative ABC transport system permease protein
MIGNYLVTALRNIVRHKLYSFINIAGLTVGLACAIFVILFVRDELSYDTWIPGTEKLYRVEITQTLQGRPPRDMALIGFPMPEAMRNEIPGVTGMTRLWSEPMTLISGDRQFVEAVNVVDPGFFKFIRLPLISGDPDTVFRQPDSVVLSQSAARKYFGDSDPVGRILTTGRGGDCIINEAACGGPPVSLKVTGVMRDLPHNTHLAGDVFFPNTSIADRYPLPGKQSWYLNNGYGYVSLAPGTDPGSVTAAMGPLLDRMLTPELKKFDLPGKGSQAYQVHLTPFRAVHLTSARWAFNLTPAGSWTTVYGVIAIGVLVLLVACFNFMNLATAGAMLRAREIALRKIMGAKRRQLGVQFLGEAVLTALMALVLAFALAEILLPAFDHFLGRPIDFNYAGDWTLLLMLVAIAVAAGLIGGSYPALVLSGFRPAATLGTYSSGKAGSAGLRNVLVVLQFAVSIGLGIAAAVVFSQISYARMLDLGFRHDNILVMEQGRLTTQQRDAFLDILRAHPGVIAVSQSNTVPFDPGQRQIAMQVPGRADSVTLDAIVIDPDYPKLFGMRLVAGRLLSRERAGDRRNSFVPMGGDPLNENSSILVNQAGARSLGFTPQQVLGKIVMFDHNHVTIVGVLADAKLNGAREPITPSFFMYVPTFQNQLSVRLDPDRIPETLAFIDKTWRAFSPMGAIRRDFLEDRFGKLYQAEERQGQMFGVFVGVAIFIACLGLFGLAAFTAQRRTHEIGVRKAFGARTRDIVFLLLWQFSIPVLIANAIAWPVAWYYLHGWLETFAYHIALSPLYFLGSGAAAMAIAWATVFTHARRVAGANPIRALRTE